MVRVTEADIQGTFQGLAALVLCVPGQLRAWAWCPGVLSHPRAPSQSVPLGTHFPLHQEVLGSASPPAGVARDGLHRENTHPQRPPVLVTWEEPPMGFEVIIPLARPLPLFLTTQQLVSLKPGLKLGRGCVGPAKTSSPALPPLPASQGLMLGCPPRPPHCN